MNITLVVGILLDLATAAFFLMVAGLLTHRLHTQSPIQRALRSTMWFWYGAAGFMVLDGGYAVWVLNQDSTPLLQLIVLITRRTLFAGGTMFLVHLLLVMARGDHRHVPWLGAYYAVVLVAIEAISLYQRPAGHENLVWSVQFVFSNETPVWLNVAFGAAIFVPLAASAIMALRLYRRMPDRASRFRLGIFCYSILSFVVGVLIGFVDNDWFWYGLFENRLVFAVGLGMWLVMIPPFWLRSRGVPSLHDLDQFPSKAIAERNAHP